MADETTVLEALMAGRKPQTRSKAEQRPYPELVDGDEADGWTVTRGKLPQVDLPGRELLVPLDASKLSRRGRMHELGHVAMTPRVPLREAAKEAGANPLLVNALEDARIHGRYQRNEHTRRTMDEANLIAASPKLARERMEAAMPRLLMAPPIVSATLLASSANAPEWKPTADAMRAAGFGPLVAAVQGYTDALAQPTATFEDVLRAARALEEQLPELGQTSLFGDSPEQQPGGTPFTRPGAKPEPGKPGKPEQGKGKGKGNRDGSGGDRPTPEQREAGRRMAQAAKQPPRERDEYADQKAQREAERVAGAIKRRDGWRPTPEGSPERYTFGSGEEAREAVVDLGITGAARTRVMALAGRYRSNYGVPEEQVHFAPVDVIRPPLTVRAEKVKRQQPARPKRATDDGGRVGAVHRFAIDGKALRRRKRQRTRERAGALLIDVSGSMNLTQQQIARLVQKAPQAIVAIYSGDRNTRRGRLVIVGERGKIVEKIPPMPRLNLCDGPALEWLARQPGPRVWVCDGVVTGLADSGSKADYAAANLVHEAHELCERHDIVRVSKVEDLLRRIGKGDNLMSARRRNR